MHSRFARSAGNRCASLLMFAQLLGAAALAQEPLVIRIIDSPAIRPATTTGSLNEAADTEPPPGLPPGWVVVDGDILVPLEALQRGTYATNLWPEGVVPYQFGSDVTSAQQSAMLAAMWEWESVANVNFVQRDGEDDHVHIRNAPNGDNNSAIGRVGGQQQINITNWGSERTLRHELGHCLGFYHEQSRTDRETYVEIMLGNVCNDCCGGFPCHFNFTLEPFSHNYGPYDFASVMHYRQCSSSNCGGSACEDDPASCRTIRVRDPYADQWQDQIGESSAISYWDGRVMSFLYPESGWRFIYDEGNDDSGTGSFVLPWETFDHGYEHTPVSGRLWILESRTLDVSILDRPVTIDVGRGTVVLR